jgi:uncharacterized protein DUF1579
MRFTTITLTCLCLIMTASPVLAKSKKPAQPDMNAMMDTYQKLSTPGEPHKQLASLAGTWTTKTKEWMDPSKPPTESTGTCEEEMLLDGRFLQQDCTGEMMGQPFAGIGVIGYDNFTKKYTTTWMSSMGTGIFSMNGTASADGKTITLHGSHPDPFEGVMKHRAIWKFVDANTQTFEMYGGHGHDKEKKMMEITYTRKQ